MGGARIRPARHAAGGGDDRPVLLLLQPVRPRSIAEYQQRLRQAGAAQALPVRRPVYGQFQAFADAILDKLGVWQGRLSANSVVIRDPHDLHAQMYAGRGQILVGSYLGNLEVCRALVERGGQLTLNVLVHTRHAEAFNRILAQAGATRLRLIQVSELDAAIMLQLNGRIERGERMAGHRGRPRAGARRPHRRCRFPGRARGLSPRALAAGGAAQNAP